MSNYVLQSSLPSRCLKETPKEEISVNAKWLIRGGFVNRLMGGVYSYLPLGLRVLQKIENIVRDEMNALGSAEILMPALHPQSAWETTGRWDKMQDIIYRISDGDRTFGLGPTHEEIVTPLIGAMIHSYKDLPMSVYQIQTKYRNEARPKSGLLRGREFRMKDMYSFHVTQEELDAYYDRAIEAYHNIFRRCGIGDRTFLTYASGGVFSKYSHEFQAITPHGEDTVYLDRQKKIAVNKEIVDEVSDELNLDKESMEVVKAIEVGNIFKLGTRFAEPCGVSATLQDGSKTLVQMGCYGIGTSRMVGTCVELCHDENGIIWPESIAPFHAHIIVISKQDTALAQAKELAEQLSKVGKDALIDDRAVSPGQKFAESDIIGIPHRIVISDKTLAANGAEWKQRTGGEAKIVGLSQVVDTITSGSLAG